MSSLCLAFIPLKSPPSDISMSLKVGSRSHHFKTRINPQSPWRLNQIQDSGNHLANALAILDHRWCNVQGIEADRIRFALIPSLVDLYIFLLRFHFVPAQKSQMRTPSPPAKKLFSCSMTSSPPFTRDNRLL